MGAGGRRITRRTFLRAALMLAAGLALPSIGRAAGNDGQGGKGGANAGAGFRLDGRGWPQPPSFDRYAARVGFPSVEDASTRLRSRKYPVLVRAK